MAEARDPIRVLAERDDVLASALDRLAGAVAEAVAIIGDLNARVSALEAAATVRAHDPGGWCWCGSYHLSVTFGLESHDVLQRPPGPLRAPDLPDDGFERDA